MTFRRHAADRVYNALEAVPTLGYGLVFVVSMLYYAGTVGLTAFEMVLVGTVLEATVLLFEIPTGVVADVVSRRLSIVVGYALIGAAFVFQGFVPSLWAILVAQVVWGVGYTFTSGAEQAWLADEIGEEAAGRATLRAARLGQAVSLVTIPLGIGLGIVWNVQVPVVVGGAVLVLFAGWLALRMPEVGFRPTPREDQSTWGAMRQTLRDGLQIVRRRRRLRQIVLVTLVIGAASESFDRLWTLYLLSFPFPSVGVLDGLDTDQVQLVWFGAIAMVVALVVIPVMHSVERRVDTTDFARTAGVLLAATAVVSAAIVAFALAPGFAVAVVAYLIARVGMKVSYPLSRAWLNNGLEPGTRATVLSLNGQADAVGQTVGGPVIGLIGNASLRAALLTGAALLGPAMVLYARARRVDDRLAARCQH